MYAEVLVQYGVKSLDHTFTYIIPESLRNDIKIGMKVFVPFGSQEINGFVTKIKDETDTTDLKEIKRIVSNELKLNDELLELGKYIKDKTLCTLISAYQTMLPTSLKINNSKETYELKKTYIVLNNDINIEEYINNNQRAKKQLELIELIRNSKPLKKDINCSALKILLDKNIVKEEYESYYRIEVEQDNKREVKLTEEQESVYNKIKSSFNKEEIFLLHGITGSGKTEVYMELCKSVIKENKTVIVLVPEISLTHQIVKRFYNTFGNDVAIFHSSLSEGEKFDEYKKIERGEVHIVVGTRSAIFTPMNNIGLIIIDEEHSSTYKQENNPRYHALDIAKWRCHYHSCPLVLGSATPSLESMARAQKGVYTLVQLKNRVNGANLPDIKIIDMQPEYRKRNMILSEELQVEIMKTLERKEQVMLLLNRRGYSTVMTCTSCGYTYKCPHCDITLTYHKTSNKLQCHYCGYTLIKQDICPECNEKAIQSYGLGTEKLESFLHELYPSYNILRMDRDTTTRKGSHEKMIKAIENHEYDIIIGTQMISKGLDFPKVTLVGIVNADESLNIPDFRSGENTFSLLAQVSGRAGRSNLKGKVFIQTFNPENKTLLNVLNHDYMSNYQYEMDIRRKLKYPPYYYLISLKVTSKKYDILSKEVNKIADYLRRNVDESTIVLGPTTAPIFKINNVMRFQITIKYRQDNKLFEVLKDLDEQYILNKDVNIEIDIDPLRI